jgi:selenide,water dikinase
MDFPCDDNVLVGLTHADDAGVYRVSDDVALIQTVDFFTPVVENPRDFGRIAAANALSDVYAMGGVPKTAMNLVAFPSKQMDLSVLRMIIQGGIDILHQSGTVLMGGHSIEDTEIKYGLSVTGFVHPDRILTNANPRPGDCLVLTKPLGTGIMSTAARAGLVPEDLYTKLVKQMAELNKAPAEIMTRFNISACTDITGFGLLGHLAEMIHGTGTGICLGANQIPVMEKAAEFADMGLVPAAAYNNRDFRQGMVTFDEAVNRSTRDILFDPQTSGGLLLAVHPDDAKALVRDLTAGGVKCAALIGSVTPGPEETIVIHPSHS